MLMLHTGAQAVEYDGLRQLPIPDATDTHVPIPHYSVVDMVKYSLGFFGHEIVEENYGVTPDGARFFGVLSLRSEYGDYTDTVGLRNSHDKRFPIGISFGSRVFVCDNLAFNGDHVIKRKHTANAKRDLPGLVAGVVEPLRAAGASGPHVRHLSPHRALRAPGGPSHHAALSARRDQRYAHRRGARSI
jgi:hypothetical protein